MIKNSMKECLRTVSWMFWMLLIFITVFISWIIKHFFRKFRKSWKLMTHRFYGNKCMFLLVAVIKNLPKVVMQWYNYSKLIWLKQNISFACSNYQFNWQLINNFSLHLSDPSRIETQRKRIVNRIVTTDPRWTINSVNHFTTTREWYRFKHQ